jgi:hypothetical protein
MFPRALESKELDQMLLGEASNTIYIDRKPYFLEAPPIAVKLPPLGCHLQGGGLVYSTKRLQGKRGQGVIRLKRIYIF